MKNRICKTIIKAEIENIRLVKILFEDMKELDSQKQLLQNQSSFPYRFQSFSPENKFWMSIVFFPSGK